MRNIIIIAVLVISSILPSFADTQYLSFTEGWVTEQNFKTIKTIDEGKNYIDITYTFEGAQVFRSDEGDYFSMENALYISSYGEPNLPYYMDQFLVPTMDSIPVEVVASTFLEYEAVDIRPSIGNLKVGETAAPSDAKRGSTYNLNAYFPKEITPLSSHRLFRGAPLVTILTYPVQFNPVTKTVRCYSSITYRISLDQIKEVFSISDRVLDKYGNMVTNDVTRYKEPEAQYHPGRPITYSIPENFLFVTVDKLKDEVKEYAEWKTMMGYNCTILSKPMWKAQELKDSIKQLFDNNEGIDYLMLVGNSYELPTKAHIFYHPTRKETINIQSDKYYACLTDSARAITDFSVGRIVASRAQEVSDIFKKLKRYESNPPLYNSFYNVGHHIAYFQDTKNVGEKPDGVMADGYTFVETSEVLRERLVNMGKVVGRIYAKEIDSVKPQYYTLQKPLPEDLKFDYIWEGNTQTIHDKINTGCNYVLYSGHGNIGEWSCPKFTHEDAKKLENGDWLPFVFSAACFVGKFDGTEGLAEAMLRNPNGGAAGMMGNTHYGWSGTQDRILTNMVENLFNKDCQQSFADAMESALINIGEDEKWSQYPSIVHSRLSNCYFGDPSMRMYAFNPGCITPTITSRGDTVVVDAGVPKCQITLVSQENPLDMSRFKTVKGVGSAKFANIDYPYLICVKKAGYAPYYTMQNYYIQNKEFESDSVTILGNNIYVGNNVNANKPNGDVICQSGTTELKAYSSIFLRDGFHVKSDANFKATALVYRYSCDGYNPNNPDIYDEDPFPTYNPSLTALEDIVEQKYTLYPNPTTGQFNVDFGDEEGLKVVQVYGLGGALLYEGSYSGEKGEISLSNAATGIYLIRIVTPSEVVTKRLMKK